MYALATASPGSTPVNPGVEIAKVLLEILPVVLPRHPVHPRRGLGRKRPIRRPEAIDVDVVQERGEPCLLVLHCDSAHATKRTWRALPGTASGTRFAGRVPLAQPLPSTASAAARAALFGSFAGSTGLSDFSRSFIEGLPPWRSPRVPPQSICHPANHPTRHLRLDTGDHEISRLSA